MGYFLHSQAFVTIFRSPNSVLLCVCFLLCGDGNAFHFPFSFWILYHRIKFRMRMSCWWNGRHARLRISYRRVIPEMFFWIVLNALTIHSTWKAADFSLLHFLVLIRTSRIMVPFWLDRKISVALCKMHLNYPMDSISWWLGLGFGLMGLHKNLHFEILMPMYS